MCWFDDRTASREGISSRTGCCRNDESVGGIRGEERAIEGNIKQAVPEWGGQLVQMKLEQSALFDGERVIYLAGRQTRWHVVR